MPTCSTIAVVIIHHDPLVRAYMAQALEDRPRFEVLAVLQQARELADGPHAIGRCVVVADHDAALGLAEMGRCGRLAPQTQPIALVSSCDREWELRIALERRVRGYLSPGFDEQQLIDCLEAVDRGTRYLCQRTSARLAESLSYEALTERETAVVRLVVRGLPNKLVARELDISLGTVKSHLKSAYAKLQVTSRTQAIAETQRRGLLEPVAPHVAARPTPANTTFHGLVPSGRLAHPLVPRSPELRAA